jgi:hypothetical protein
MIYLCASGRSYDIPQEVFDEITALKAAVITPPPVAPTNTAEIIEKKKGG